MQETNIRDIVIEELKAIDKVIKEDSPLDLIFLLNDILESERQRVLSEARGLSMKTYQRIDLSSMKRLEIESLDTMTVINIIWNILPDRKYSKDSIIFKRLPVSYSSKITEYLGSTSVKLIYEVKVRIAKALNISKEKKLPESDILLLDKYLKSLNRQISIIDRYSKTKQFNYSKLLSGESGLSNLKLCLKDDTDKSRSVENKVSLVLTKVGM